MIKNVFSFKAKVWLYEGPSAWHFITLPTEISKEVDFYFGLEKKGWGSLPVEVTIGDTSWKTSIFPDKKVNSYILPLKKEVRTNESIKLEDIISVQLKIRI